jgi:hypothetical protein
MPGIVRAGRVASGVRVNQSSGYTGTMLHLTLGTNCPRCYRDEWTPNGFVHDWGKDLTTITPEEAEHLVPISTTKYYRCAHCGTDITIEERPPADSK